VKNPAEIEAVLERSEEYPEILSLVIVCSDKIGMRGAYEIKSLTRH